jgi:hypothetical protein
MNIKKNTSAKVAAIIVSLTALGGIWALVRQNPPASAQSASPPISQAAPRGNSQASQGSAAAATSQPKAPQPQPVQPGKKHTRTRTS